MLARLLIIPQWFNPLVWLAIRRLDESIEMACDDHVVGRHETDRVQYAKAILRAVEFGQDAKTALPALAATGPPIKKRIQRIVQPKGNEMKFTRMLTLFLLTLLSLFTVFRFELVAQQSNTNGVHKKSSLRTNLDAPTVQTTKTEPIEASDATETDSDILVTESYYVGDLIFLFRARQEIPDGITLSDFKNIKELITSTVASDLWAKDGVAIQAYPPKLSLIVSNTREIHWQIQELLQKLRKLTEVTISWDMQVLLVERDRKPETEPLPQGKISDRGFENLRKKLEKTAVASSTIPKHDVFNGQQTNPIDLTVDEFQLNSIQLMATHGVDRQSVSFAIIELPKLDETNSRLGSYFAIPTEDETKNNRPGTEVRYPNQGVGNWIETASIASKGVALIDVSRLLKDNSEHYKAFLLVRPTVIVKRDEIVVPDDQPKKDTGGQG